MHDNERRAWLRLARTENVGPVTFRNLMTRFGSELKQADTQIALRKVGVNIADEKGNITASPKEIIRQLSASQELMSPQKRQEIFKDVRGEGGLATVLTSLQHDPGAYDELINLQQSLHKTSIFITHDFAEALKLGDRIAIMKDGAFVQVGTPEEVVLHPADEYVAAFTKDAPRAHVLTARSVMGAIRAGIEGEPVRSTMKLDALISRVLANDSPAPVVDESGAIIGCVDRADVLRAMSVERV